MTLTEKEMKAIEHYIRKLLKNLEEMMDNLHERLKTIEENERSYAVMCKKYREYMEQPDDYGS